MNENEDEQLRDVRGIASVRLRPSMYVGSTEFFGFIHYVVSAFDIMLHHGATWIEIEVADNTDIHLSSDANVPVSLNDDGELEPFEACGELKPRYSPDAMIVTALSGQFRLTVSDGVTQTILESDSGERKSFEQNPADNSDPGTEIEFYPDYSIFSVTEVSPWVVHSYCKRTACLHPGVLFRVKIDDEVTEYKSARGIRDFFDAIATPYQILHKPIHIHENEDDLTIETVFVFQSWTEYQIWSFANKGRVPDGGTHEAGMLDAVAHLHNEQARSAVGILAVLAIEYPHVTFEGCIKARIGNPELRERVRKLVRIGLDRWVHENEEEVEYLNTIERFQFADTW